MPSPFEFPTDNPDLFTARPPSVFPSPPAQEEPEVLASAPIAEPIVAVAAPIEEDEAEIEIVESFDDDEDFARDADAVPSAPDPIAIYLSQLTAAALSAGASNEAVGLLAAVLGFERFDASRASEPTLQALHVVGLVDKTDAGWARQESVVSTAQAWSVALAGQDPDFSACGSKMLDEWSAEIVSKLAGAPQKVELVRRDLRSRGIAAFGLVEAA